jgi:hypothetical protein
VFATVVLASCESCVAFVDEKQVFTFHLPANSEGHVGIEF